MNELATFPKTWSLTPNPTGYQSTPFFVGISFASLDEVSLALPNGAYTTFRTYPHRHALHLEDHLRRLQESARRASVPVHVDPEDLRSTIRYILAWEEERDYRVRITLDLEKEPGHIYVSIEPLHTPSPEEYRSGVKVISKLMERENPKAKLTGFIKSAHDLREKLPEGIHEVLMVRGDGTILEGLSSNFFGVRNGTIFTADRGVLEGITRSILLNICDEYSIPIRKEGVYLSNVDDLDEAFITSASRAVLPVTQIDRTRINLGKPGPLTCELMAFFQERIRQETSEI